MLTFLRLSCQVARIENTGLIVLLRYSFAIEDVEHLSNCGRRTAFLVLHSCVTDMINLDATAFFPYVFQHPLFEDFVSAIA